MDNIFDDPDLQDPTLTDAERDARIDRWLDEHLTFEERFERVPLSTVDRERCPWRDDPVYPGTT